MLVDLVLSVVIFVTLLFEFRIFLCFFEMLENNVLFFKEYFLCSIFDYEYYRGVKS